MNVDYACVQLMLLFCAWSGWVGIKTRAEFVPFGRLGKTVLIFNSVVLASICIFVLAWRTWEMLQGKP